MTRMAMNLLDPYFDRIGFSGKVQATYETLRQLHFQHATQIPFENIDIQLGRKILLDIESLARKMIDNNRGGYCFEHNSLLYAVLRQIGFDVIPCEARVRMGRRDFVNARTHMVLLLQLNQTSYLCDVGFGGEGLLEPVPVDGEPHDQFVWRYRVITEGRYLLLQSWHETEWFDLYAFLPDPCAPIDFEVANWYTSTHPRSRFVQTLTAQLPGTNQRYIIRNREFVIQSPGSQTVRTVQNQNELLSILSQHFRLHFDPQTQFRNPVFE